LAARLKLHNLFFVEIFFPATWAASFLICSASCRFKLPLKPIASGHQSRFHQEPSVRTDSLLEQREFEPAVRF
jgi:hypothetical protein